MQICFYCGVEEENITECPYCKQQFCSYHSDPSMHDCPGTMVVNPYQVEYARYTTPAESVKISEVAQGQSSGSSVYSQKELERVQTTGGYKWHIDEKYIPKHAFDKDSGVEMKGIFWRAGSEFMHVLIASILMYSMGFITNFRNLQLSIGSDDALRYSAIYALLSLAAFLVHEFSHRQTAVYYGFQTKFRLVTIGVIITVISILAGGGFGVPGAVVIIGLDDEDTKHQTGVCKSAGPFSNVIFGAILIILAMVLPDSIIMTRIFLLQGAFFNFALGAFNLLPVAILDGANIIRWNTKIWVLLVALCILGIVAYFLVFDVLSQRYIEILMNS